MILSACADWSDFPLSIYSAKNANDAPHSNSFGFMWMNSANDKWMTFLLGVAFHIQLIVFAGHSVGSLRFKASSDGQRRRWSDVADAQADLSHRWAYIQSCSKCYVPVTSRQRTCAVAGLGGSVGCAVRLETRRSRVQPPPRSATFFRGDWSWNIFYGHSLPSADSRRAVVSFWRKNVHSTG